MYKPEGFAFGVAWICVVVGKSNEGFSFCVYNTSDSSWRGPERYSRISIDNSDLIYIGNCWPSAMDMTHFIAQMRKRQDAV